MRQVKRGREPIGVVAVGRVGREPVQHPRLKPSVGAGREDRLERQPKLRPANPSMLGVLGLTNANHRHLVANVAVIRIRHVNLPQSLGGYAIPAPILDSEPRLTILYICANND